MPGRPDLAQNRDGRMSVDNVSLPNTHVASAHLIRVPEAARITGLPPSTLRKSFMRDEKRPRNIPLPPPHKRIGRAVYIIARELPGWIASLDRASTMTEMNHKRGRGRPTVAQRITRREG